MDGGVGNCKKEQSAPSQAISDWRHIYSANAMIEGYPVPVLAIWDWGPCATEQVP